MTLGIGLSLVEGLNPRATQTEWGDLAGPYSDAQILAALDAWKDSMAAAIGVSGSRANLLYPQTFMLWCRWPQSGTGPGARGFPGDELMDGLRERGVMPFITMETGGLLSATTLAAAASAGATVVKYSPPSGGGNVPGLQAGNIVYFPAAGVVERRTIASVGTSGAAGTGVTLTAGLTYAHASGAVVEVGSINNDMVNEGLWDDFLDEWSQAANAWRDNGEGSGLTVQCEPKTSRIICGWDREMNADWNPWRPNVVGNTVANWKAKWRRIHDRIRVANGATHVEAYYCPMAAEFLVQLIGSMHPGDAYVQWVGFDQYEFNGTGTAMASIYAQSVAALRAVSARPIMVGETGVRRLATNDAVRAAWLANGFPAVAAQYPDVRVVSYFDIAVAPEGRSWRLNTPATRAAMAGAMDRPAHQGRP